MRNIDIEKIADIVREVAAEVITPRFRDLADEEIHEKRPGQVVTEVDLAAEARLIRALAGLDPTARVVGEEMIESDPNALYHLLGDDAVWVIDPLDGTANYSAGKEDFAVMVAYVVAGQTVMGCIYVPIAGRMVLAERGAGATVDGTRARLRGGMPLDAMVGFAARRVRDAEAVRSRFGRLADSRRCVGVDYVALASGALDFAHYRRLSPWDHAPGALIHAEAGGVNRCIDGVNYAPGRTGQGGLLLAPDQNAWQEIRNIIRPYLPS